MEDYDVKLGCYGLTNGKVTVKIGDVIDLLKLASLGDVDSKIVENIENFEIVVDGKSKSINEKISLNYDGEEIISVSVIGNKVKSKSVKIPSDTVDDPEDFASEVDVNDIIDNLLATLFNSTQKSLCSCGDNRLGYLLSVNIL